MRKSKRFFGGRLFPCILLALLFALFVCAAAVWLPRALAPLAIAERLFSFAVALFLAGTEPRECAVSKLVLLLLLPWAGAALCIIWRRIPAAPLTPPLRGGGSVLEKIAAICGTEVCCAGSAEYFPAGSAMKERLLTDLAHAETSVWLEYYIVE
ncbi:MAG: hypothetical protein K2H43_07140, partial [Clostridia bacterium]|nr:hypothetical protein [Clostridia bacterium]